MGNSQTVGTYLIIAFIVFIVRLLGFNPQTFEELMYHLAASLIWLAYPIKWLCLFIVGLGDALIQVIKDLF